jgi:hypothetical protein
MSMDETVTRTPDDQRPNRISTSATLAAQASARAGVNGGYWTIAANTQFRMGSIRTWRPTGASPSLYAAV